MPESERNPSPRAAGLQRQLQPIAASQAPLSVQKRSGAYTAFTRGLGSLCQEGAQARIRPGRRPRRLCCTRCPRPLTLAFAVRESLTASEIRADVFLADTRLVRSRPRCSGRQPSSGPKGEIVLVAFLVLACGQAQRREADCFASPCWERRSTCRPPWSGAGQGDARPCQKASPAASSRVPPSSTTSVAMLPDRGCSSAHRDHEEPIKVVGQRPSAAAYRPRVTTDRLTPYSGCPGTKPGPSPRKCNDQRADEARSAATAIATSASLVERGVAASGGRTQDCARRNLEDDAAVMRVLIHRRRRTVDGCMRARPTPVSIAG